jgi:Ca-activated chloride channel family protein
MIVRRLRVGFTVAVMIGFLCSFLPAFRALAATQSGPVTDPSRVNALLVVDVSKSMLTSDPNKISNEAMKMFIDMTSLQGDKVGVVAYANDVVAERSPVKFRNNKDKQALKDFIDSLGKYPNTDLSTGLSKALTLVNKSSEPGYVPMIVLLADGNNDLDKTKPKTAKQADEELAQVVAAAAGHNACPIYVIGLNADGTLNKKVLKQIADSTQGKFFETSNAADLPEILSEIFADHLKLKVVPMNNVIANDQFQDVKINVPNSNVLEANISLISRDPVQVKLFDPAGKEVVIPSDKAVLTKSKAYSLVKLLKPAQGDWTLRVKGFPKDKIDVNLVFNYDLELKLAPLAKQTYQAGDTVDITAFFEEGQAKVTNLDLYQSMKAVVMLQNLATGKTEKIPLTASSGGFFGKIKLGTEPGNYNISVFAEGNSFFRETSATQVTVQQAALSVATNETAGFGSGQKAFPWAYIALAVAIVWVLIMLVASILKKQKNKFRGFSGQIVLEVINEDTGYLMKTHSKKLKSFKGEFNLRQLFMLEPEYEVTDRISFKTLTDNALLILNQTECMIEKDDEVIDASTGQRFKRNDKLRIVLEDGRTSIFIKNIP